MGSYANSLSAGEYPYDVELDNHGFKVIKAWTACSVDSLAVPMTMGWDTEHQEWNGNLKPTSSLSNTSCMMNADSISAIDKRRPETLITSLKGIGSGKQWVRG